jgi:hypothetical protein
MFCGVCNFFLETPSNIHREQNATSFLMGQLSVAYGGTTEKLAQFFSPRMLNLDIAPFID